MRQTLWLLALLAPAAARGVQTPPPGALEPETLKLPDGPASMAGMALSPELSEFTGQLGFRLQLPLPTARAGFGPALSLSYKGGRGMGVMGAGWSLETPAIQRRLDEGLPHYDGRDELELVGSQALAGRLVAVADGEYRLQGRGQEVRIQREGENFLVTDQNGLQYRFGFDPSARLGSGGRIHRWLLARVDDLSGQSIRYGYGKDQGQAYLESVQWGPEERFHCQLSYEARPDPVLSFATGQRVQTAQRLQQLEVRVGTVVRHRWNLTYASDEGTSRLARVERQGREGEGSLPMISFEYLGAGEARVETWTSEPWSPGDPNTLLVDVDGDGLSDLLHLDGREAQWARNQGDGFGPAQGLPGGEGLEVGRLRLMDLDGDHRSELVGQLSHWSRQDLSPSGLGEPVPWAGSQDLDLLAAGTRFADLNGDGRADLIDTRGQGWFVHLNGADGLASPIAMDLPAAFATLSSDLPELKVQDLNGDGLADLLLLGRDTGLLAYGTGDGFTDALELVMPLALEDPGAVRIADLDRDGLSDLVVVEAGHVQWSRGLVGGGFGEPHLIPRPEGARFDAVLNITDLNGNGSQDLVWAGEDSIFVMDIAGSAARGLLRLVDNGLGYRTEIRYEASARLGLAAEAAGEPWSHHLPVSMPVVVAMARHFADGTESRHQALAVADGLWDPQERRFAGFLVTRRTQMSARPESTLVLETHLHGGLGAERSLRGKAFLTRQRDGNDRLLSEASTQWLLQPITGLEDWVWTHRALPSTQIQRLVEGTDEPVETQQRFRYDDEGNRIYSAHEGRLDIDGDETIEHWSHVSPNPRTWLRGRVLEHRIEDGEGIVQQRTRRFYDGLPNGQIEKGWLSREEGYFAAEDRWVLVQAKEYDRWGNATATYAKGSWRHLDFDGDGLFALREWVEPGPDQRLVWQATWDPVLGRMLSFEDPNGVERRFAYDDLGRLIGRALGETPLESIRYDWEAPRPCTVVTTHDSEAGERQRWHCANGAGEPVFRADRAGTGQWVLSEIVLRDDRGQVASRCQPVAYGAQEPPLSGDFAPHCSQERYEALNRPTRRVDATGAAITWRYGPAWVEESAPGLAPVTRTTDGQGRSMRTERQGGADGELAVARYDAVGRLLEIDLGGLVQHRFAYDSLGRLSHSEDPEQGRRSYVHDDAGRVIRTENAAGQHIDLSYDAMGRLTERRGSAGTVLRYGYDSSPETEGPSRHLAGRLAWVEEPTGRLELGYDAQGRQNLLARTVAGEQGVERRRFSPSGLLLAQRWGAGAEITQRYDALGRLVGLGSYWEADLDAAGRIIEARLGNGVVERSTWDAVGRLIAHRVIASQGDLLDLEIERNDLGAPIEVSGLDGLATGRPARFRYDEFNRLTEAELHAQHLRFRYDGLQNLVAREQLAGGAVEGLALGAFQYEAQAPRLLSQVGGLSLAHDAAGRAIAVGERQLNWDAFDRLLSVTLAAGGQQTHRYGLGGLRTLSTASDDQQTRRFSEDYQRRDGVEQVYLRAGGRAVVRLVNEPQVEEPEGCSSTAAGGLQLFLVLCLLGLSRRLPGPWRRRVETAGLSVFLLLSNGCGACSEEAVAAPETHYMHRGLGPGPSLITDSEGQLVERRRFTPFGHPIEADVQREPTGWGDKAVDGETHWADHGARWLAHDLGRWLAPDPPLRSPDGAGMMAAPWGLNPYGALANNPMVFEDTDGEDPSRLGAAIVYSYSKVAKYSYWLATGDYNRLQKVDTWGDIQGAVIVAAVGPSGVYSSAGVGFGVELNSQLRSGHTEDNPQGIDAASLGLATGVGALGGAAGDMIKSVVPNPVEAAAATALFNSTWGAGLAVTEGGLAQLGTGLPDKARASAQKREAARVQAIVTAAEARRDDHARSQRSGGDIGHPDSWECTD